MRLENIRIENFRGIRLLDLDLDRITVLIGENNHGKTSVFDVLGLCLGERGSMPGARFRASDFHRDADGTPSPVQIRLTFGPEGRDRDRLRLEFRATPEDPRIRRRFVDADGCALDPQPEHDELERLQKGHPVLLLRFAHPRTERIAGAPPGGPGADGDDTGGGGAGGGDGGRAEAPSVSDRRGPGDLAATVARVYHDLASTRGPLPPEQIERGLDAARRLLTDRGTLTSSGAPLHRMLDELRTEVRRWTQPQPASAIPRSGSGSHNLALLLVLGAILDVNQDEALPSEARPIIAIEEPESHLHPILLASTWDVIEALGAQTVVTTNSGELLSSVPMALLRRLVRGRGGIEAHRLGTGTLSETDLRRVAYHVRAKRGGVLFARCWLLVEGESEFWLLTQLADVLGYDLEAEGVRLIEFAQCGVAPLAKLANDLGIHWHLLADGDESGSVYARDAEALIGDRVTGRVSKLGHRDVEQCLWHHGFDDVYRRAARYAERPDGRGPPPRVIISKAVRKRSKPYLALAVADACAERGRDSIPSVLRDVIESTVSLARESSGHAV